MAFALLVAAVGGNRKLGPGVATTYRPVGPTCPLDCAALAYCYARRGLVSRVQRLSAGRSDDLRQAAGNVMIRHVVSGDWFRPTRDGRRIVDRKLLTEAIDLHSACPWLTGWGYTHGAERLQAAGFGPDAWPKNFRILASCHDAGHAQELQQAGWQTARMIDSPADRAENEILCPYDLAKHQGRAPSTTCQRCRLCVPGDGPGQAARPIAFLKF